MANRNAIRIEGAKELERKLKRLEPKLARKAIREALKAGAKLVLAEAKRLAPIDTGLLLKSLKVRAGKRRKGQQSVVVQTKEGDFKGETFYAAFLEFGHKLGKRASNVDLGVGKRKRRTEAQSKTIVAKDAAREDIPAKPFLRPAFDAKKLAALKAIRDALAAAIVRLAKSK